MIRRELGFFIFNGIVSVIIAYLIYRSLVSNEILGINAANGVAYISGMVYGFFANKNFAFEDRQLVTRKKVIRYISLHAFTLVVNMYINSVMLGLISGVPNDIPLSFLTAISISTILNFLGLKYFVFYHKNIWIVDIRKLREFLS